MLAWFSYNLVTLASDIKVGAALRNGTNPARASAGCRQIVRRRGGGYARRRRRQTDSHSQPNRRR